MKKLKKIKKMIQIAQKKWSEIEGEIADGTGLFHGGNVDIKMDKLKNLLEDIRVNIEAFLVNSRGNMLVKCKNFLETILLISENLRVSYVFPGYVESYYIMDTLKFANSSNES